MVRFLTCLQGKQVWDVEDFLIWSMTKSDKFTVKSLYHVLEPDFVGSFPIGIWILWV